MRVAWKSNGEVDRGEPQMLPNAVLRLMTVDTLMNIRSSDKKPGPLLFPPCD